MFLLRRCLPGPFLQACSDSELNKHYNLYEYTTPMNSIQKFNRQAVVPQRRWLYTGPLKNSLTIEERFARLGITCATLKLLKEGM